MFWCLFLLLSAVVCDAELFTAMVDLESFHNARENVNVVIDDYIQSEMTRLEKIKQMAKEYKNRTSHVRRFGDVKHPVNAFLLISDIYKGWEDIEQEMHNNKAKDSLFKISEKRKAHSIKFPKLEDIQGAAEALLRLQDVYQLKTEELADGKIMGLTPSRKMNAKACFDIGLYAYNMSDHYHAIKWLQEAHKRVKAEETTSVDEMEIIKPLAHSLDVQGNTKRTLSLLLRVQELDPEYPAIQRFIQRYRNKLPEQDLTNMTDLPKLKNSKPHIINGQYSAESETLCKGETIQDPKKQSKLYCYYKADRPYLLLARVKVELLVMHPMIVLFHDVMSDYEIEKIKNLATPRLKRAYVQPRATDEPEPASYRISKSAWLNEDYDPIIATVNARIDMMTNLNVDTAEEDLQVLEMKKIVNYGLGGHYREHFDMSTLRVMDPYKDKKGNRVATFLSYMSDVEAGGATVFPNLNTAVFPKKGTALFWYNLYRDGEADRRTLHAACPVLAGVKWVSNKWIRERGQEWRRPCNVNPGENHNERWLGDLPDQETRYYTDTQWYSSWS